MDVTSLAPLTDSIGIPNSSLRNVKVDTDNTSAFQSLLDSAINMYSEANQLQKHAEVAELNFAMGYSSNTHDLALAQQKATIALQYTVKVTNKILDAYKELMQIQL